MKGQPRIVDRALAATKDDPFAALLLVLELIWAGRVRVSSHGITVA
jgi:hypothetical protein